MVDKTPPVERYFDMNQIFVDCHACGYPNAVSGADPSLLAMVQSSPDEEPCSNCRKPLDKQAAYTGEWSPDGMEVWRTGDH